MQILCFMTYIPFWLFHEPSTPFLRTSPGFIFIRIFRTFLTAKEAAVYLGGRCNHETVHALIYKGELKAEKVGWEWRIMPESLDENMNKSVNIQPDPSVVRYEQK